MVSENEHELYFRQMEVGPMANFVYLVGSTSTREAYIVDPAWDIAGILKMAQEDDMRIAGALVSHTHPDHVGGKLGGHSIEGVTELLEACQTPIHVHKSEVDYFEIPNSELAPSDAHTELEVGGVKITFIHTPGHTPGSQCFKVQCGKTQNRVISGDTLFIGGCGRTDLPGSDPGEMYESLTQKLMKLEEATLVFPGHNYAHGQQHSTIGAEKTDNPFVQFPTKTAFLQAMGYNL